MRIATVLGLCNFAAYVNAGNDCAGLTVKLVDDIDLTGVDFTPIKYFCGTFDGDGHTISNLRINSSGNCTALFGFVGENGTIANVKLSKIRINGGDNVGVLVGYNSGAIANCSANGTVSGDKTVGGLAGSNSGKIVTSASNGTVNGNETVGGLVGSNSNLIENCASSGTVGGKNYVGGFVGSNGGTIQNCLANGTVSGKNYVGDFVGINNGCVG